MARPLTKISRKTGKTLTRLAAIEANIDGAIGRDIATLTRRLEVIDKDSGDFLTSECLVHLSREFHRLGERKKRDLVSSVLFCRVEHNLNMKIDNKVPNAETLREDILQAFAEKLAMDGNGDNPDELDFYEVRFNRAFKYFRINMFNAEIAEIDRMTPLPGEPPDDEEAGRGTVSDVPSCRADQGDRLAYKEIVDRLPPKIRKAVVLVYLLDYEIESEEDPNKSTAATICGVSGRAIRYRLKQAAKYLPQFKED